MVPMVLPLLGLLPPPLPAGQPEASRVLPSPPGLASVVPLLAPPGRAPLVLLPGLSKSSVALLDRAMVLLALRGLHRAVDPMARPSRLGKASNPSAETVATSLLTSPK